MKRTSIVVCMGLFFILQAAQLEGQVFNVPAKSNMDKAFAEPDAAFTPQDEYFLGRAVAAALLARYRPYTANPELTNYLNRICRTIAVNSGRPEIYNGYCVIVLDSAQFNAFATPGGHILITKALVEAASSEDALASVIAHEMAHIVLRHGIALVDNAKFSAEMAGIAARAADFAGKNSAAAGRVMELRNSVAPLVDAMVQNGYSREQEFEADKEAAALLAAAGYDPAALVDMLRVLQRVQTSQKGGFNSTHPTPVQRIASVETTAKRYRVADTRAYRMPRFKKLFP